MSGRVAFWLLLPVAGVCILILAAVFGLALAFLPPFVSIVSLVVLAVIAVWFFFARGRGEGPASEGSLLGRQKSKEGLL